MDAPPAECPRCGKSIPAGTSFTTCPACLMDAAVFEEPGGVQGEQSFSARERKFGDYILERQIGSGGMGVVYEARQISLNRRVALKFIRDSEVASPTVLRRFTIEAEAAARLNHPNIVRIHEIGESGGEPFLSMDLVVGESLKEKIAKRHFALPAGDVSKSNARNKQLAIAKLMVKTARAVHHAHQRGVLHRDLKPGNILIDESGEPQLTDFGLAKILRTEGGQPLGTSLTPSGDVTGTLNYMSPEQVTCAPPTACSDVYQLGAILYELLTGRPPFHGATPVEILRQIEETQPKQPRARNPLVDRDLDTICMKCLEKDARFRYASAEDLAADLENWMARKPIRARPAGPVRLAFQWAQRNPLGTLVIGLLLFGLAAALAVVNVLKQKTVELNLRDAEKFRTITSGVSKEWRATNTTEVRVESKDIAVLANRTPVYDPAGPRVTFGMTIYGDAVYFAQSLAKFLAKWEEDMSRLRGETIYLDVMFFKPAIASDAELLAAGRADFMLTDAASYIHARTKEPSVQLLASEIEHLTGLVVARSGRGITNIEDLRAKSIMFSAAFDSLTLHAKAALYDAGITARELARVSNTTGYIEYSYTAQIVQKVPKGIRRETLEAVFGNIADAGITTERRFLMEKHRGLVGLNKFQCTPNVFVARGGLDPAVTRLFRETLLQPANQPDSGHRRGGRISTPDEPFVGAQPVDENFVSRFQDVLEKAANFDTGTKREP